MATFTASLPACRCAAMLLVSVLFAASVSGQSLQVTVEGRVEAVYLNTDVSHPVYIVQLWADDVVLSGDSRRADGAHVPVANETIFIVCDGAGERSGTRLTIDDLPRAGNDVRVRLMSRDLGKWSPAGRRWFETIMPASTPASQDSPPGGRGGAAPQVDFRGMKCEAVIYEGRLAFAVKSVAPSGPARDAGFQVGDIVVAVDGQPLNSVAALNDIAVKPVPLALSVVDVNTGRLARVELAFVAPRPSPQASTEKPAAAETTLAADHIGKALGIDVILTRVGLRRTAVAVSRVDPAGAAAQAGIEVSDVITAVDNEAVGTIDELAAALPAGGGKVTLLVRDVRTGDDVPVSVASRPLDTAKSEPDQAPRDAAPVGEPDGLGLTVELAFHAGEAAVRVTGVQRGSPASRAGIQVGWLIVAANGKPVLHPDELKEAEKNSSGRLRLRVVDPRTDREMEVNL